MKMDRERKDTAPVKWWAECRGQQRRPNGLVNTLGLAWLARHTLLFVKLSRTRGRKGISVLVLGTSISKTQ